MVFSKADRRDYKDFLNSEILKAEAEAEKLKVGSKDVLMKNHQIYNLYKDRNSL